MKLYTVFYLVGYRPYVLLDWLSVLSLVGCFQLECFAIKCGQRPGRARPAPRTAGASGIRGRLERRRRVGLVQSGEGRRRRRNARRERVCRYRPIVGTRPMAEAKRRLPVRMPRRPNPASLDAPTPTRDCSRPARNRYLPPRRPPPRRPRRPQASHGERALSGPRATRRQVCRAAAVVPRSPRPSGSMLFIGCSSHPPNGAPT